MDLPYHWRQWQSSSRVRPNWGHPDHDACGTGFIARLGGHAGHDIIDYALTALERLTHRGGVDADGASGDGAGLLAGLPRDFFKARAAEQRIDLPEQFGLGFAFFPSESVVAAKAAIEAAADQERLRILGWRCVPVNPNCLGRRALETMPESWQFFVAPFHAARPAERFEWRLSLLRKKAESLLPTRCYVCSLSSQTVVYKGLLTPWQFPQFYQDLREPSFETSFVIFHQRYSTNTQPSWNLAQPFRYVAHNGEINTIVSNRRWLRAKENKIREKLTVGSWFHVLEENVSDSASFDNGLEAKLLEGFSVEEAMLALVPPAFENDPLLSRDVRGALAALSQHSEPWDGPAALIFSDGQYVGAKLDRNGLRPMRYTLTHDGLLVVGSETGLVDFEESRIAERSRLGPGEMILAKPDSGMFLRWRDILKKLGSHQTRLTPPRVRRLDTSVAAAISPVDSPKRVAASCGWTEDQFKILFSALVHGKEADWSMGDDAPPAFLSTLPRTLWSAGRSRPVFIYPSGWQRAPGTLPPFGSWHRPGACHASRVASYGRPVEVHGARWIFGCSAGCRNSAGIRHAPHRPARRGRSECRRSSFDGTAGRSRRAGRNDEGSRRDLRRAAQSTRSHGRLDPCQLSQQLLIRNCWPLGRSLHRIF